MGDECKSPLRGTLGRLTRTERFALNIWLQGSMDRMCAVATRILPDYRQRAHLLCYGEMMAETAELVCELDGRRG